MKTSANRAILATAFLLLALAFASKAGASVYWGNEITSNGVFGTTIGRANDDGTGIDQGFIDGASSPTGVAVDAAHVYWINSLDQSIGRANLDGSGVNENLITGVNGAALAVDGAHVYWTSVTDTGPGGAPVGAIGRANLDGSGVNPDFISGVSDPEGVALDDAHVYWTNGLGDAIGRANLDGSAVNENFIDGSLGTAPTGVAVDATHIYWAEVNNGAIGRANLDGSGVNEDFIDGASRPFGVAVDSAHLYWTNRIVTPLLLTTRGAIGRANLDGSGVNQTFIDGLANPVGVAVDAPAQAGQPARISADDVTTTEGDAGQTAFRFTISLDAPESAPVSVDFATADGTATAPGDYGAASGTVTFAPGETAKTVTVQVEGDTTVEPDETFNLNLTNATGNATIADPTGVGTIVNDDQPVLAPPSRISVDDVSMAEGNSGQTAFRFAVSLDTAQSAPVTVDFSTADGTASAPGDYLPTSGTVMFAPGETAKTVTVQVEGDTRKEPDETFSVNLSNAAGHAAIADGHGIATILNDDRDRRRHKFTLGPVHLNLKAGTARLSVTVPGPGGLAISGADVTASEARSVRAAGTLQLLIKPSGSKLRTLNRTGTVTVRPTVTYTTIGGTPSRRSTNIRLRKRPGLR